MAKGACVDSVQEVPVFAPVLASKDSQTGGAAGAVAMSWTTARVPSEMLGVEGEIFRQQSASWSSWECFGRSARAMRQQQDATKPPVMRQ